MKKPPLGLTQIFWGEGKGKTTAALGAALRACGQGYTVHLVQFMKNGTGNADMDNPGELRALENIPNFSYKRFGAGSWVTRTKNPRHEDSVREAVLYLKYCFGKYNFLIADEILYSVPIFLSKRDSTVNKR